MHRSTFVRKALTETSGSQGFNHRKNASSENIVRFAAALRAQLRLALGASLRPRPLRVLLYEVIGAANSGHVGTSHLVLHGAPRALLPSRPPDSEEDDEGERGEDDLALPNLVRGHLRCAHHPDKLGLLAVAVIA